MSTTSRRLLADDRRLSTALTSTQVINAACMAFSQISSVCSATASQDASSSNWAIVATITTTAVNAASAKQSLDLFAGQPLALATNMKNALVSTGALSAAGTIACTGVIVTPVAAQPYVAASYPVMTDKPFKFTFLFTNGLTVQSNGQTLMNVTQIGYYNQAVVNALVAAGLPSGSVGASVAYSGTSWGANCSVYPVAAATNTSMAILQYIGSNPGPFGTLITAQLQVLVGSWTTPVQIGTITLEESPTYASATGVSVTINGSTYTGLFGEGGFYNVDDSEEQQKPAMSGAWVLPLFGAFSLFTLVAFIGMGIRKKQQIRTYKSMGQMPPVENDCDLEEAEPFTGEINE